TRINSADTPIMKLHEDKTYCVNVRLPERIGYGYEKKALLLALLNPHAAAGTRVLRARATPPYAELLTAGVGAGDGRGMPRRSVRAARAICSRPTRYAGAGSDGTRAGAGH